jgi:hypothetical protein
MAGTQPGFLLVDGFVIQSLSVGDLGFRVVSMRAAVAMAIR